MKMASRASLAVGCVLLATLASAGAGCSPSAGTEVPSQVASRPATPSPVVLGPYRSGQTAIVRSLHLEFVRARVRNSDSAGPSELLDYGNQSSPRPSLGPGAGYVDVTVRIRDFSLPVRPDAIGGGPEMGTAYVMAGGKRYPMIDGAATGLASELPTMTIIKEFAVPTSTPSAVMYWPTSEAGTQAVTFSLW